MFCRYPFALMMSQLSPPGEIFTAFKNGGEPGRSSYCRVLFTSEHMFVGLMSCRLEFTFAPACLSSLTNIFFMGHITRQPLHSTCNSWWHGLFFWVSRRSRQTGCAIVASPRRWCLLLLPGFQLGLILPPEYVENKPYNSFEEEAGGNYSILRRKWGVMRSYG